MPARDADDADLQEQEEPAWERSSGDRLPDDAEVPEADALDQREATADGLPRAPSADAEVPEADALEQATAIPDDDER